MARYEIASESSTYNWQIVDTERTTFKVVAICRTEVDAKLVCGALNFNNKPSEYGFKLVY